MPDQFQYDVFLSHSAKDKAVVRPASLSASNGERAGVRCRSLHSLRQDGLKVWPVPPKRQREGGFDEWVLKAGDSIPTKIDPPSLRSYGRTREGLEHSRVLACPAVVPRRWRTCPAVASARRRMLCMSAHAFGSDWAQLEAGTFRFRDPLNKERRFIPLRGFLRKIKAKQASPGCHTEVATKTLLV